MASLNYTISAMSWLRIRPAVLFHSGGGSKGKKKMRERISDSPAAGMGIYALFMRCLSTATYRFLVIGGVMVGIFLGSLRLKRARFLNASHHFFNA